MEITGAFMPSTGDNKFIMAFGAGSKGEWSGAFYKYASGTAVATQNTSNTWPVARLGFAASRSWTGATSSKGSHSHTLSNSVIRKSDTVQPNALKLRVKTRYK